MKLKKLILCVVIASLFTSFAFARKITVKTSDGKDYEIDLGDDIPDMIVDIIENNLDDINAAIKDNDITEEMFKEAEEEGVFDELKDAFKETEGSDGPSPNKVLDGIDNGFNGLTKSLAESITNAQFAQNVWADAWVGNFFPFIPNGVHIGAGTNVGASRLKLEPLKNVAKLLDADMSEIPDDLIFPVIDIDLRIGGIFIPFDIGFSVMALDLSKFNLDIEGIAFKYSTFGIDARYALLKGEGWLPKVSVGAGVAYTSVGLGVGDDDFSVNIGLNTFNFYLQTQISKKLAVFIPFAGFKLGFSNTNLNWNVNIDWKSILGDDFEQIGDIGGLSLSELNILPNEIGQGKNQFITSPQFFGGIGLDLFIINLTVFGGIDVANAIWSAGLNFRIAW